MMGRRHLAWAAVAVPLSLQLARPVQAQTVAELEEAAFLAYSDRRFQEAVNLLTQILQQDSSPRWLEMRAQVLVDGKNFDKAIEDFNQALKLTNGEDLVSQARLKAGRALAYEGLSEWRSAINDYDAAMELAARAGESPDAYVINSIGNCYNSLGQYAEAREAYLVSSQLFQQAKGFRGRNGSTTPRLDGAIFAASNAALMLAQLGDVDGAISEMTKIARRAPGSADMRAALAALYWARGDARRAEDEWEYACDKISVGCRKYQDQDWLRVVRRWPPAMVQRMNDFLTFSPAGGAAAGAGAAALQG